jgi:hypothetical protein
MIFIESELFHVSPLPPGEYEFDFKIQIVNGETGAKTRFINISADQFKAIENILLESIAQ